MKKKTTSNKFIDSLTKLSDLKRKKISNTIKKDLQFKNKSITDFIAFDKNNFPANIDKIGIKTKKICENNENMNND